jgi:Putative porin
MGCIFCCSAIAQKESPTPGKRDTTLLKRRTVKTPPPSSSDEPKKRTTSKIINDSVKAVYGPKTSTWTTETELFYNKKYFRPLDTAINNFHRWTYVQKANNFYQDLGNMGTALNSIFPAPRSSIGATIGYNAYAPYFENNEPRYYDTKSPFTRLYVIWAGRGRATTHIEFTRNISPRWNFGFNYRAILVEKQLPYVSRSYQTISHYYDFFSTYKTKNERYFLAFNYRRIRHRVKENGGVVLDPKDTTFNAFFIDNVKPYWANAQNEDLRHTLHLHQRYQLAKPAQIYLTTDYSLQANTFSIDKTDSATQYFKSVTYFNAANTGMEFKSFQNQAGLKGNAAFLFYDFYLKVRSLQTIYKPLFRDTLPIPSSSVVETYLGSQIAFRFDSLKELRAHAEYLLDGNYKIDSKLSTPWFDASLLSVLAKPSQLQQSFRGIRANWKNNFSSTFSNQVKGNLKLQLGRFFFSPGLTYSVFSNYIYFKNDTVTVNKKLMDNLRPIQSSGNQQVFSPEVSFSVRFLRHFHFRPHVIYTQLWRNDDNAIRVPELFVNAQLAYENFAFGGALQMQLGIDLFYRSDYKALGYAPDIQTFYNQDERVVKGYWVADVFLNAKIKGGRLFFKYHNAANIFLKPGYMLTYGYPAMSNILDFGFEIPLFD